MFFLKKLFALMLGIVVLLSLAFGCRGGQNEFALTILHTNDWHGVLDDLPQYATLVYAVRAEVENVILLDGGDLYRRGPFQSLRGQAETEVMNAIGYDAMVFGNNDFPQNDRELVNLSEHTILQTANFPVLCGNVTQNGRVAEGFAPYVVLQRQGLRIAVIGVTSAKPWDRGFDLSRRYDFEDPAEAVARMAAEIGDSADIHIVLSHAGIAADRRMRGVSAIVGGDDHLKLAAHAVIGDGDREIPVVQAGGERDHYLGRLDLVFVKEAGVWVLSEFNGSLLSTDDVYPDAEIAQIIDGHRVMLRDAA